MIHWFEIIGQELRNPSILPENVYNMDETGIILSAPHSMKMLVSRDVLCIVICKLPVALAPPIMSILRTTLICTVLRFRQFFAFWLQLTHSLIYNGAL